MASFGALFKNHFFNVVALDSVSWGLARFNVAGNHRRCGFGREKAPFGDFNIDGFQAPFIHWNISVYHASENIQNSRAAHSTWRIEVVVHLGTGAGEIDIKRACVAVHTKRHANNGAAIHLDLEICIVDLIDNLPDIFFCIVLHKADIGVDCGCAKFGIHGANVLGAGFTSRDLGKNIGAVLCRVARQIAMLITAMRQQDI